MNGKTKLLILIAAILLLAVVIVLMVSAGNGSAPDEGKDPIGETQTTQAEDTGNSQPETGASDATDGTDATQSATNPTENENRPQSETTVPATTEPTVEKPTIGPPDDGENDVSGGDNVIDFNDLLEAAGGDLN